MRGPHLAFVPYGDQSREVRGAAAEIETGTSARPEGGSPDRSCGYNIVVGRDIDGMTRTAETTEIGQAARPAFQGEGPAMLGSQRQHHPAYVPFLGRLHLAGMLQDGSVSGHLRLGKKYG